MNVVVLGSGAFGIAISKILLINHNHVTIWSKFESEIQELREKMTEFQFTSDLEKALSNVDMIVIAIPIEFIEETLKEVKKYYHEGIILIASKGISVANKKFAYQILEDNLENAPYGILSGGTFAKDMLEGKVMGITLATKNRDVEKKAYQALHSKIFKVQIVDDIIGTSVCGAVKNVMAIAFGIMDGAIYPPSSKFLFLTEAILEIKKILVKLGGNSETILSYAGIDDIMMTCTSIESRNYTLGFMIGKKMSIKEIDNYKSNTTIEGLLTCKAVYYLLREKNISSKLIEIIYQILYENIDYSALIYYLESI